MRKSDRFDVAASAIKGAATAAGASVTLGWATFETVTFFGLVTTGTAVSLPLLGAFALGGAALWGGASLASKKYRNHRIKKEFEAMRKESD